MAERADPETFCEGRAGGGHRRRARSDPAGLLRGRAGAACCDPPWRRARHGADGCGDRAGVLVANVPAVNASTVAEHVLLVTLALLRRFRLMDRELRQKGWAARAWPVGRGRRTFRPRHGHCRHGQCRQGDVPDREVRFRPGGGRHERGRRQACRMVRASCRSTTSIARPTSSCSAAR